MIIIYKIITSISNKHRSSKLIMAWYNHRYMYMYFKTNFLPFFTFEVHHPKSKTKLEMVIWLGRKIILTFPSIMPFVKTMSNSGTHHGFTKAQTPSSLKLCTLHDNTLSLQIMYITWQSKYHSWVVLGFYQRNSF